jgi:hypothetical protein
VTVKPGPQRIPNFGSVPLILTYSTEYRFRAGLLDVDLGKLAAMNQVRRVLLTTYLIVVAYCLVWIPWCIPRRNASCERVGYGWLWAGPTGGRTYSDVPAPPPGFVLEHPEPPFHLARPDLELMGMRLLAATVLLGAGLACTGVWRRSATHC